MPLVSKRNYVLKFHQQILSPQQTHHHHFYMSIVSRIIFIISHSISLSQHNLCPCNLEYFRNQKTAPINNLNRMFARWAQKLTSPPACVGCVGMGIGQGCRAKGEVQSVKLTWVHHTHITVTFIELRSISTASIVGHSWRHLVLMNRCGKSLDKCSD